MNHFSLLGRLLLVFIITTLLSCTDHLNVPTPHFRVKTITYSYTNPGGGALLSRTILLTYNAANQLVSYRNAGSFLEEMIKDKLIKYTGNYVRRLDGYINKNTYYWQTYSADTQGRIIKMEFFNVQHYNDGPDLAEEFTYAGNSTTPSSRTATTSPGSPFSKTRTELYTFSGGNATSIDGASFTYDNSPNPYKGLFGFGFLGAIDYFGTTDDIYNLNRPFSISEQFSDMSARVFNQNNITTDAQLTYNSDGLVTKIVYKDGNSESFTYESY